MSVCLWLLFFGLKKTKKTNTNKTRRRPTLEGQLNHSSSSLNVLNGGGEGGESFFMNERNELNESLTRAGQLRDEQVKYAAKTTGNIFFFFFFFCRCPDGHLGGFKSTSPSMSRMVLCFCFFVFFLLLLLLTRLAAGTGDFPSRLLGSHEERKKATLAHRLVGVRPLTD